MLQVFIYFKFVWLIAHLLIFIVDTFFFNCNKVQERFTLCKEEIEASDFYDLSVNTLNLLSFLI